MGTNYDLDGSETDAINAYNVMCTLKLNVSDSYSKFSKEKAINLLSDNWIIFQTGKNLLMDNSGHAWIIDGYRRTFDFLTSEFLPNSDYFSCNWGWSGKCNGFYKGEVMTPTENRSYQLGYFFAMKIED